MATTDIVFDFRCDNNRKVFSHTHALPTSLLGGHPPPAFHDPFQSRSYHDTINRIVDEHQAECLRASSNRCEACGAQPVANTVARPVFFGMDSPPRIWVFIAPACASEECIVWLNQRQREVVVRMVAHVKEQGVDTDSGVGGPSVTVYPCAVCGKADGTMRCSRCKVAAYCGEAHQEEHWPTHRKGCVPAWD